MRCRLSLEPVSKVVALCCVWAVLVGVSVPLDMINQVTLNGRAARPELQSIFTSAVIQGTDFLILLPLMLVSKAAWGKPTRWWTLLAGLYGSPIFFMPLAVTLVGSEATVLVVLSAQLCTALMLDLVSGLVKLTDWQRLTGFSLVLLGAFVNASDASQGSHLHGVSVPDKLLHNTSNILAARNTSDSLLGDSFGTGIHGLIQSQVSLEPTGNSAVVLLAVAAIGGMGVTFESKCNCLLAKDLGCWSRAACWDAFISVMGALPVGLLFYLHFGATPVLLASDWMRFLFSGMCVGFFQSSMSVLPEKLGFSVSFMCVKFGCLFSSTYIDAKGLGGMVVPISSHRLASLFLVFVGCTFFATSAGSENATEAVIKKGYGSTNSGCKESKFDV